MRAVRGMEEWRPSGLVPSTAAALPLGSKECLVLESGVESLDSISHPRNGLGRKTGSLWNTLLYTHDSWAAPWLMDQTQRALDAVW